MRWTIAAALGVLTWLLLLLAIGALVSLWPPSFLSFVAVLLLGLLFVPLYRLRPWEPHLGRRVIQGMVSRRPELLLTAVLFGVVNAPLVSDTLTPILRLVLFPLRIVPGVLYGVRVVYAPQFGVGLADGLFDFGRRYIEVLWLYVLAAGLSALYSEVREDAR